MPYGSVRPERGDNKGTAAYMIPGGSTIAAGGKSTGVEAGLRHAF